MQVSEKEQLFTKYRPLLFSLAYQMLGSVQDAEDSLQDSYIKLMELKLDHIQNHKAYLCKIVTNHCMDYLKSAKKKRETYVGPWLPEPMVSEENDAKNPEEQFVLKESISTAYLLLLEQLSETERAVLLLREAFQFDYETIAEIVGKSSANCRQIFHRSKKAIGGSQSESIQINKSKSAALTEQFVAAMFSGDVNQLLSLLAVDAKLLTDGGGKVTAAIYPIIGAERVARFYFGILARTTEEISYRKIFVNDDPGLVIYLDKQLYGVLTFQIENGVIGNLYFQVNPDKLLHVK